ncbi:type VII secretion protein EccCa [Streptomyces sp. CB01881]|uniref:type VII secretion protein EccCa n=1 Tax=Streptomyces sp. CB01881 TaxID=2078691 RepID=UPI000CDC74B7|nr:type VII secretion protein EccCa [Streptomyces sp. CB01881]AUY54631.1 secretion protein EccC [Streptomyces sp. CB01881]TYC70862.1 type VII secretion protein EccCa [Streptomyces sp. CB01881]
MPDGEVQLQEPPSLPEKQSGMASVISMMPMALGSLSMVFMFLHPGGSEGGGALSYVAVGMMALSAVGMLVTQLIRGSSDRKQQLRAERRDYLRYLSQVRRQVRRSIDAQRQALAWRHPAPGELWSLVGTTRLWERRSTHPDFSDVRIGLGAQRLATPLAPLATKPVEDLEPLCAHALRRFIHAYGTVADQPMAIHLRGFARLLLRADDPDAARALVRAMLAQLAVVHGPDELRIAVVAEPQRRAQWEWAKWLPHALHPSDTDGAGPVRLVAGSLVEVEQLLGEEFTGRPGYEPESVPSRDEPFTVLVLDGPGAHTGSRAALAGYRNTVLIDLDESLEWRPARTTLRLRIDGGRLSMVGADRNRKDVETDLGRPDALGLSAATRLAALLARYRIADTVDVSEPLATDFDLTALLGIPDLHALDVEALWAQRGIPKRLRVPLGFGPDGRPVDLDLKESAQGGMGPHGMLIGATGSGKSELLRTLVVALAMTHSSEVLNFVLVDFKGGATFLGLDTLPHTSAVITNLADEAALVDRMRDALHGELIRRQEVLRESGHASLLEYETAREGGAPLRPMPTLFLVVDEFSELLAAHRDFMELFVMIGRLGRSLGVHLLLASQRLDEGRMSALESHLSYRIGLRTFSAMESRGVLGVPDAYQLPSQPGNGFLRSDISTLTRFKAAYVSGPYRPKRRAAQQAALAGQVVGYGTEYLTPRQVPQPAAEPVEEAAAGSLLDIAAGRLRDAGPPAHRVWLPPLAAPPTLDELLPPLVPHAERGLTTADARSHGALGVPVGVIDRPFQQLRDLLTADLAGAGGHVGIAGAPQSGKSTLLRTLITGLALTHTPQEAQFYCLDFGGGTLSALRGLPHVGGVTGRHDGERVLRTVAEINSVITRREKYFAELGIDSITSFRRRKAAGALPDDPHGDVFLVIDGWNTLRQEFGDLVQPLTLISQRGINYGVHLVIATTRWGEIVGGLRDQLQTRFELRLGDSVDSVINMRAAAKVPKVPGRGLTDEELHFLTALPRIDGASHADDLGDGVADLVDAVAAHWTGPRAPEVRMLPLTLDAAELPTPEGRLRVPIGLEDTEVAPLWHDFEENPHLLVVGDSESGKTNLLRLMINAITTAYTPSEARIMLVDYRRELYDSVPEEYRLGYAVAVDMLRQIVDGASRAMKNRIPSADITPARLKLRDWWEGPELFILVDDYDLVGTGSGAHPFAALLDDLAQGSEIGLHLVVARGANGIGRALGDPLLRKLQEVNSPSLLLSCPPSEGYLFGNLKPRQFPAGRGLYITRRRTVQVQTGRLAAAEGEPLDPSGP